MDESKKEESTPSVSGVPHQATLSDIFKVADGYRNYAINKDTAHHAASMVFERKNKWLGVPATIIAAVVGSSIFATLASDQKNVTVMVITGLLSIGAAILSALQTFLRYSEIAQAHKTAASGYEAVRRKIDIFKLHQNISRVDAIKSLDQIAAELNDLGKTSPAIADEIYDKAVSKTEERLTHLAGTFDQSQQVAFSAYPSQIKTLR